MPWFYSIVAMAGTIVVLLTLGIFFVLRLSTSHWNKEAKFPTHSDFSQHDAWTAMGGSWSADQIEVRNNSDERGARLMSNLGAWSDYQVEADLKIVNPFGVAGIVIRSSGEEEGVDAYHGYFAGMRSMDNSIEFGRADYGWHSLFTAQLPANENLQDWVHMRVVAVGCHFGIFLGFADGKMASYAGDDADCLPSGRFGLRSYLSGATWSNIHVEPTTKEDLPLPGTAMNSTPSSPLPTEPVNPSDIAHYRDTMQQEAEKYVMQPGVSPIADFLWKPGRHPNATIQGVIISLPPLAGIQDDSSALIMPNLDPSTPVKIGDEVEVHGTVISERFRSRMEDAHLKVLWSETPIAPWAVSAVQLTNGVYRGRYISVEGTLLSVEQNSSGYQLVLSDAGQIFNVIGSYSFQFDPSKLELGSRLQVRGNSTSLDQFTHGNYPFTVIAAHVEAISAPPWWSLTHVLCLLAGFLVLFALAQLLLNRVREWHMKSILREREQLAFEMHDTLAQSFTGIAYQLQAAGMERRGMEQVRQHIQNALHMVHLSHREASRTISSLRPQYRESADIASALGELANRLSDGSVRIETKVEGHLSQLPLAVTDALYRIGQEAVTNALQHSGCSLLTIHLQLARQLAVLRIHDDGKGINPESREKGLGMDGMRSRAAKIRAHMEIDSSATGGTTIAISAPLPRTLGFTGGLMTLLRALFLRPFNAQRYADHKVDNPGKKSRTNLGDF
jgi:signal transduction histidine kinase